jgi:hypothetical protein
MSVTTPAPTTSVVTPNIDTSHSTSPSTGESTVVDPTSMPPSILTPTTTPDNTGDPRYDSADAIGPLSFGENSYKIYLGDSLVIFNTDKTVFCDLGAVTILDRNLFILSASFMDINFDEVPDFSYFEPDGRRICYLGNAQNGGFFYNDTLSSLYNLTRCYETYELFATESQDAEIYYSYKFENGELICLAMPTLDQIREFRKYDIGAIFTINSANEEKAVDLIWKYAIDTCLKDNSTIGNANSDEDDSPLGVAVCENVGLVKVAKNCGYSK